MKRIRTNSYFAAALIAISVVVVPLVSDVHPAGATGTHYVTCTGGSGDSTAIQNVIEQAASGDVVHIRTSNCDITTPIDIDVAGLTVEGATNYTTHLIFAAQTTDNAEVYVKADNVTVQYLDLNTATNNTSYPPQINGDTDPQALYSTHNGTTFIHNHVEAGGGFGVRFVGPDSDPTDCPAYHGMNYTVSNNTVSTIGLGGYAAIDVDCTNGATVDNNTVTGGILSLYQDENVTMDTETYSRASCAGYAGETNCNSDGYWGISCKAAWFDTGPAYYNDHINLTSSAGGGIITETAGGTEYHPGDSGVQAYVAANHITTSQQTVGSSCSPW